MGAAMGSVCEVGWLVGPWGCWGGIPFTITTGGDIAGADKGGGGSGGVANRTSPPTRAGTCKDNLLLFTGRGGNTDSC